MAPNSVISLTSVSGATPDNRNGLVYGFKQYGATYGVTPVAQATGNGFLYTLAPTVTPGLTGTTAKVYDGTTTATLLPANFTAAGAVDGDTVTFTSTGANYNNRNVGVGKAVTATGLSAVATNGAATVYGYTPSSTSVSANIGTITPAALVVTAQADSRVYDGTTASSAAPVVTGATYDAVGTTAMQPFDNRSAGTGKTLTASGLVMADGNGGANYTVSYVNNTVGVITPAPLSIIADDAERQATLPNPLFTATYTGLVGGDTSASLTGTLDFTTPATITSPKGTYPITPFGQTSTNYTITYVNGQLVVTAQPYPPQFAGWARFDPQTVAAHYSSPVPFAQPAPTTGINIVSGGLNVRR